MLCLVTFSTESQGQVAMVIYEWKDVEYLGKETPTDEYLPVGYLTLNPLRYVFESNGFVASRRRTYAQVTP
jgi:hypothetical protein